MASSAARPLGPLLPPSVLELSKALPLKPAPVTLRGRFVTLVPYEEAAHLDALYAVSCGAPALGHPAYDWDTDLWRYLLIPSLAGGATVAQCTGADGCLTRDAFTVAQRSRAGAADRRIFVVLLHEDGATSGFPRDGPWAITAADGSSPALVVGQIALMRNAPADLTIEIGVVCMSPAVHGTPVATEATYLLLRHAFAAGYRRVEWKANALNARSCAAALRMGFTHEGVFRQHMVVHDGCVERAELQTRGGWIGAFQRRARAGVDAASAPSTFYPPLQRQP